MPRTPSVLLFEIFACLIFGLLNACSVKNPAAPEVIHKNPEVLIAYPSSTTICVGGCQPHRNWIQFHLVSNSFSDQSLRLKTSIWPAQILTVGISGAPCDLQDKPGTTCINMLISHRLLWGLTAFNLTPLNQLRDISNWWLEYISPRQ